MQWDKYRFAQSGMFDEALWPGIVFRDFFIVSPLGIVLGESRSCIAIGYSSGNVVIVLPLGIIYEEDRHRIATRYHLRGRSSSYRHRVSSLGKVVVISPSFCHHVSSLGNVVIVSPPGIIFGKSCRRFATRYSPWGRSSLFRHQVSSPGEVIIVSPPGIISGGDCHHILW